MDNNNISITLGKRIRSIRQDKDLKIADLAKLTGLTVSMISQVERAIISPSIETLKKIGNAMDIPLSYLFESTDSISVEHSQPSDSASMPQPITMALNNSAMMELPPLNLAGQSPVVHRNQRKLLSPGKGIQLYLLNPNLNGPIEFIYNEYEPGSGTGASLYSHPGSECGLILSGELVVQINSAVYVLSEGDSITFNSTEPHSKKNLSDEVCTCVWANVPPWF